MRTLLAFLILALAGTAEAQIVTVSHGGTGASTAAQARINLGLPAETLLAADTAITALTATGTPLQFAAAKNSTYTFDVYGYATSSSNAGAKLAISVPSGSTLTAMAVETGTTASDTHTEVFTAGGTLGAAFVQGTSLNGVFHIHGSVITNSTAGNVILQAAKVTSGTVTVKAGAYINYTKVQ